MRLPPLDKIVFVLSVAFLAWFWGFAASTLGWFPNDFLIRAWNQALTLPETGDRAPRWTTSRVYERAGVRIPKPDQVQPGLTLIASNWETYDWQPGLKLIDSEGETVHAWKVDPAELFPASADRRPESEGHLQDRHIHGFHLFPNGDVLVNVVYVGTVRLDACGRMVWRVSGGSHHTIERAEDGSFWIPGSTRKEVARSSRYPDGYPGLGGSGDRDDIPMYQEEIIRISGDGQILDKISVFELLYSNDLERHIVKASRKSHDDITHLNDVEPLSSAMAGGFPLFDPADLLISLRNLDLVLVFDPETSEVKWHTSHPVIQQHDPDFLRDGWIGIFDNNRDYTQGEMLGGSRIVTVQPHTDSVKVAFPTALSDPFHTKMMGEWQRLENGNMLLTESYAGRIVEVAPDGRTVWEWVGEPYDSSRIPVVTGSERVPVGLETAASWLCPPGDPIDQPLELES